MIEGITDCLAGFLGEAWCADPGEVDRIAKPAARMLARRPWLQNIVKTYTSPAVFVGAVGAYGRRRILGLRRAASPDRHLRAVDGPASSQATPATGSTSASSSGGSTRAGVDASAPHKMPPEAAAALAQFTARTLDDVRSRIPS